MQEEPHDYVHSHREAFGRNLQPGELGELKDERRDIAPIVCVVVFFAVLLLMGGLGYALINQ